MISSLLKDILACPACADHPHLVYMNDKFKCEKCHREYPIENNIPNLIIKYDQSEANDV